MFTRYWLIAVVLGVALTSLLQAQEKTGPANNGADSQQNPSGQDSFGIPVRIIEDSEAREARERGERESQQREKEDLIAQQGMNAATQSMNEATQSMKWAAWFSTIFVAIGTALLVWTLRLTRQANNAAQAAVAVTREIGEAQTAAYIGIQNPRIDFDNIAIRFEAKNFGNTPAYKVFIRTRFLGQKRNHHFSIVDPSASPLGIGGSTVGFLDQVSYEDRMSIFTSFEDVFGRRTFRRAEYFVPKFETKGDTVRFHIAPGTAKERRCKKRGT